MKAKLYPAALWQLLDTVGLRSGVPEGLGNPGTPGQSERVERVESRQGGSSGTCHVEIGNQR